MITEIDFIITSNHVTLRPIKPDYAQPPVAHLHLPDQLFPDHWHVSTPLQSEIARPTHAAMPSILRGGSNQKARQVACIQGMELQSHILDFDALIGMFDNAMSSSKYIVGIRS